MRPVIRGCLQLPALYDGSVDLDAIMLMNDAIDVADENERRAAERARG